MKRQIQNSRLAIYPARTRNASRQMRQTTGELCGFTKWHLLLGNQDI
jgi:hypothetical protein